MLRQIVLLSLISMSALAELKAQLIEHAYQTSYFSRSISVTQWNDSLWAFGGEARFISSFYGAGQVVVVGTDGTRRLTYNSNLTGFEVTAFRTVAPMNDSILIAAGEAIEICDVVSNYGFVEAIDLQGTSIWQKTYGLYPFEQVLRIDSTILVTSGDQFMLLDLNGDSLMQASTGTGIVLDLDRHDDRFLITTTSALMLVNGSGAVMHQWNSAMGPLRACTRDSIGIAAVTASHLYHFDDTLALLNFQPYDPLGDVIEVFNDLGYTWLVGGDTVRFLDSAMVEFTSFPMEAPAGLMINDAAIGTDVIMTAGAFTSGPIITGAGRSIGKHGELASDMSDAALVDLQLGSVNFQPISGWPDGYFNVTAAVQVRVKNLGQNALSDVTLEHIAMNDPGLCGPNGIVSSAGFSDLFPGDSTDLFLGGVMDIVFTPDSSNTDLTICIRATSPNGTLDHDTSNDEICGVVEIPLGFEELLGADPLHVFPNPVTDELWIAGLKRPTSYMIEDMQGRLVQHGSVTNSVDMQKLESGSYVLLLDDARRSYARFVKH